MLEEELSNPKSKFVALNTDLEMKTGVKKTVPAIVVAASYGNVAVVKAL
eukprot:COSAG06_NODE_43269_length_373_cov_1.291971_1_plen_48_part_01